VRPESLLLSLLPLENPDEDTEPPDDAGAADAPDDELPVDAGAESPATVARGAVCV
jgi:hypothetical protein